MENKDKSPRLWESSDFSVTKVILEEGDRDLDFPRFGANGQIKVSKEEPKLSVTGITVDELTSDHSFSKYFHRGHSGEWQMGSADSEIDRTLEKCLASMHPGEKAEVAMRVHFDLQRNKAEKVDLKEVWISIEFEVTLESLLNAAPLSTWYPEVKFEKAKKVNAGAVTLFKLKRYLDAFQKFKLTLKLLTFYLDEAPKDDPNRQEAEKLRLTLFSNLAAYQFQWGNHGYVIDLTSKVLPEQNENVKLLYRRGASYLARGEFDEAKADLSEAHRLDPKNKAINEKLGALRLREKKHKEQLSTGLKKMFL